MCAEECSEKREWERGAICAQEEYACRCFVPVAQVYGPSGMAKRGRGGERDGGAHGRGKRMEARPAISL